MLSKQRSLEGPVFPIPTPFDSSGNIEYANLEDYVKFLVSHGAETLMVTVGTSRFDLLSNVEMKSVNRIVAEASGKNCFSISSTAAKGSTAQMIEFATEAADSGANGLMVVFPDRFYEAKGIVDHFLSICDASPVPIFAHVNPLRAGKSGIPNPSSYTVEIISELADHPNFAGVKEESFSEKLAIDLNTNVGSKLSVIGGGGGMKEHAKYSAYGQRAYLTSIGNFLPWIELEFYQLIKKNMLEEASLLIEKFETEFFDAAVSFGWHRSLKEALAFASLISPYERMPLQRMSEDDRHVIENITAKLIEKAASHRSVI